MAIVNLKLEHAIARALDKNGAEIEAGAVSETRIRIVDAATVARMVVRTWGDEAPEILAKAAELAREGCK